MFIFFEAVKGDLGERKGGEFWGSVKEALYAVDRQCGCRDSQLASGLRSRDYRMLHQEDISITSSEVQEEPMGEGTERT